MIDGDVVSTYLRGIGLISADFDDMRTYYLHNAHGDVTALSNASGLITQRYEYDAFGNELSFEQPNSNPDPNPFRYCGEYLDTETNTYYLRARYYSPATGRFMAEDVHWHTGNMIYGDDPVRWNERDADENDPLGLNTYTYLPDATAMMQSGNLYVYGMNNPNKYTDPFGTFAIADDAAVLIILASGAMYTATVAWIYSPQGQAAINTAVEVIIGTVSYTGNALVDAIDSLIFWGKDISTSQKTALQKAIQSRINKQKRQLEITIYPPKENANFMIGSADKVMDIKAYKKKLRQLLI